VSANETQAVNLATQEIEKPLLLLRDEIQSLIGPDEARKAVQGAFAQFARGEATLAPVLNFDIQQFEGEVHIKSAFLHGAPYYTVKVASGFYRNPDRGLPVGNGLILVYAAQTGVLAALLFDEGYLTDLRTGAAGALAADLLARRDVGRVALIGAGAQGRFQLEALLRVRNPRSVIVYDIDRKALAAYAADMNKRTGLEVTTATSAQEAVQDADLVVTATPSREPYLRSEWLRPGMHITAVGSDMPEKQELFADVLTRVDKVVVDSLQQCAHNGELHHAVEAGLIDAGEVTELGSIAAGLSPGRERDEEITLADLTGVGIQDAAVAGWTVAAALRAGLTKTLTREAK
jgi:ornithine cyclodeaminase